MTRRILRGTLAALVVLVALPAPARAKWTVAAEIEPSTATADEPTELVGRLTITAHEVAGLVVPDYDQIERAYFRLSRHEPRQTMDVAAVADPDAPGLYRGTVTDLTAGKWAVALVFVWDGLEYDHTSFPDQGPHIVTVSAPASGWRTETLLGTLGVLLLGGLAFVPLRSALRSRRRFPAPPTPSEDTL